MKHFSYAAAASLALLGAACSPPPETDDVDDVEELPDQDDLGEPDNNDMDNI